MPVGFFVNNTLAVIEASAKKSCCQTYAAMFRCRYSDPFSSDKKPSARPSFCHGGTSKHTNFPCRVSAEPAACQFLQNEMHFRAGKALGSADDAAII